uniref:hypothetical protein n=1 Tax=uncultured Altererythrobacter sp. TaxID=500840 RepID=UPI0026121475|nr:hypothetical protein [uncultured Altererythrobacter sp.]
MAKDDFEDLPDPDLAQLLLLEAGRLLEDISPELAASLPTNPQLCDARFERLSFYIGTSLDLARAACSLKQCEQQTQSSK